MVRPCVAFVSKKITPTVVGEFLCILLDDLAVNCTECACRIGFVCVDVHSSRKLGAYANDYVAEDSCSVSGFDLYGYDLLVGYAEFFSISGSDVDVTLCSDNTFSDLNLTCRANELASAASCDVAGFTNGSVNAECTSVCERNLNLCSGTSRTEDDYVRDGLLRANNGNALFASKLTGLGEILLVCKSSALAEEDLNMFFREMHVTCAGFN